MKTVLCCALLGILSFSGRFSQTTQPFRTIPLATREGGYSNFESVVVMTEADLESFLNETSAQIGWNNRREFEASLRNAKLDFAVEALVLLRHDETSGSVQVTFETPVLRDRELLCVIRGKPFPRGNGGTTDMASYCFALAVSKSQINRVELQRIQGGFSERRLAPIVLSINETQPAYKPSASPAKIQTPNCPDVSVDCLQPGREADKTISFRANVTGAKDLSQITYNWSVSKGTISQGQGTSGY